MDLMKPIATDTIPSGNEWLYEVKFDGFRCVLSWETDSIKLTSRNNKDLTDKFPEVISYCLDKRKHLAKYLPLTLDGELVILNNKYHANFSWIQKRGRLKSKASIQKATETRPACFMAFDILQQKGKSLHQQSFQDRKKVLHEMFMTTQLESSVQLVQAYHDPEQLWEAIYAHKGEGMITKRKTSEYIEGKNHRDWFKVKNWRTIQGFLTHMNPENDYFTIGVYDQGTIKVIGKCKHGLDRETFDTLYQFFLTKGTKQGNSYMLPPAICASIHTLDLFKDELREPVFKQLLPNVTPADCTMKQLKLDMAMLPPSIDLTNTDKVFWEEKGITKGDLLAYIREVSYYMLPFLKEKSLTIIRAPDGVQGESFFQKHLPPYAPEFIDFVEENDGKRIICNTLDTLIWFANHGAIEYHIPFQTIDSEHPNEIVFDLDPPGREKFDLAIEAALIIKPLLDELNIISFVKMSGNKGLQIHIPIQVGSMTYDETALFTQAIAWTVENAYPHLFTTERLKKNRHGRLYIDYVQHGKDKTLIAPYSPRKTAEATVATPLFWHEVKEGLVPDQFTIDHVITRIQELGCPFTNYFQVGKVQKLDKVLRMVND